MSLQRETTCYGTLANMNIITTSSITFKMLNSSKYSVIAMYITTYEFAIKITYIYFI